jgi:cytidyltransferase-like protein
MTERRLVWVYAAGVCDLFHVGHVEFFRKARELGDRLVVGVPSAATIADYKRAPIMTLDERIGVVRGCRYVDRVVADSPRYVTAEFLDSIAADFAVHGDDITAEALEVSFPGLMAAGRMKLVPYTPGISTSQILARIADRMRAGTLHSVGGVGNDSKRALVERERGAPP